MAIFRNEARHRVENPALAGVPRQFVLRGMIATLDAAGTVIPDGYVAVEDELIVSVTPTGAGIPARFQQAPVIDTHGTIYPGLVELHNHPAYNAVPLWSVPERYTNRGQWRSDAKYKRQISNPAAILTHHPQDIYPKSVARFVECRALLGGVTTSQGLTLSSLGNTAPYYNGLIRNVEFSYGPNWPIATDYINDFANFTDFQRIYSPLKNQPLSRLVIHLCEGTDQTALGYYASLIDANGQPFIGANLVAIHGTALGPTQFNSLRHAGGLVWSPTSNFLLYGDTTDVTAAVAAGVTIAIGCDWGPSGTKNLLGELKIARLTSNHLGNLFSDEQLVRMVTGIPAKMMGWDGFVGSVEAGKQADLLVIGTTGGDPYSALISATESDVAAVVIGGKVRAGRASLLDPTGPNVELIHVANQSMVLDLVDDPNHPLAKVTLQGSIAALSYALEHLPELTQTSQEGLKALGTTPPEFRILLEMDEYLATSAISGATPIGPGDVDPMKLDPITAVDDSTFVPRLKANMNLPQWLKAAL